MSVLVDFALMLASSGIGYLIRRNIDETTWRRVRALALRLLNEPGVPNTPKDAVAQAATTVMLDKLVTETRKVARAFDPVRAKYANGRTPAGGVPVLDIELIDVTKETK